MTPAKAMFCAFLCATSVVACSTDTLTSEEIDASLTAATVLALPGADAESIEVLNPQRSPTTWRWNVKAADKVYACDADNQMRLPSCSELS